MPILADDTNDQVILRKISNLEHEYVHTTQSAIVEAQFDRSVGELKAEYFSSDWRGTTYAEVKDFLHRRRS